MQLVYLDQKKQRVIDFIILVLHIIRLATDIMTPEGTMLANFSSHCSYFVFLISYFSERKRHEREG